MRKVLRTSSLYTQQLALVYPDQPLNASIHITALRSDNDNTFKMAPKIAVVYVSTHLPLPPRLYPPHKPNHLMGFRPRYFLLMHHDRRQGFMPQPAKPSLNNAILVFHVWAHQAARRG